MQKTIVKLFYLLFFSTPFIFLPLTSELFEFNKIIFVYVITTLILACWIAEIILTKKIIFRRTPLDLPLILFILSQLLATIFSIDIHTSIFGYYSRFNGSLLSTLCYVILYWSFVSHATTEAVKKSVSLLLLGSGVLSVYGILEHFGLSPSCFIITGELNAQCFVQDVQHRVFATLGQPNWLAAYLTSLAPLSWSYAEKHKNKTQYFFVFLSIVIFLTLLYTKSRSGLLAFAIVFCFYWIHHMLKKKAVKTLITLTISFALIFILFSQSSLIDQSTQNTNGPALETGGTESGTIRQIVWKGAWNLFLRHPIIGTGVETFAYSYYETRPIEHNLTSEWDYIYNKAHNEYLNLLATTGIIGFLGYVVVIVISLKLTLKSKSEFKLPLALGLTAILVTNFFGFSVVNTSLLFFLIPALATTQTHKLKSIQTQRSYIFSLPIVILCCYILFAIFNYWYADVLYKQGREELSSSKVYSATILNPYQAVFYSELAQLYADSAFQFNQMNDLQMAFQLVRNAAETSAVSINLSPRNVNLYKIQSNLFIDLAQIDSTYYEKAKETTFEIIRLAPTDPAGFHTLGLIFANLNDYDQSTHYLEEAIRLKPNYKNARMALAIVSIEQQDFQKAKTHLTYILENIAPEDELARKQLDSLEKEP